MNELKETYTIVIVTHNMQQAARVSDRTAFFSIDGAGRPGKLVEMDATETIFSNPPGRRRSTTSRAGSADVGHGDVVESNVPTDLRAGFHDELDSIRQAIAKLSAGVTS